MNPSSPLIRFAAAALLGLAAPHLTRATPFGSGANTFTIDFTVIGNPGNAPDTAGDPNPAGAVATVYRIGTYEVGEDMLSKANALGNLGLSFDSRGPDKPATGLSWNEAARFVNWLNESKGYSAAYQFGSQPGQGGYDANENLTQWKVGDAGYNAANPYRNANARYVLPSTDEWYKAAYYNPATGTYSAYPTGSDSAPGTVAGGTAAGTAVYGQTLIQGPADIGNAGGLSPYGTMGQGGNVWEFIESAYSGINDDPAGARGLRGGSWGSDDSALRASIRAGFPVGIGFNIIGFRVAEVPEPAGWPWILLGPLAVGLWRRRRVAR